MPGDDDMEPGEGQEGGGWDVDEELELPADLVIVLKYNYVLWLR